MKSVTSAISRATGRCMPAVEVLLHQLAVDADPNGQGIRVRHVPRGDDRRADRAESRRGT